MTTATTTTTSSTTASAPAAVNCHTTKTVVATPLPGYLGNLNDAQQAAFDTFKRDVEARFGPAQEDAVWFSDSTILRYLRARRFDVAKAMDQFAATDAWRKSFDMQHTFTTFDAEELHFSKRHYPRAVGRRDRHGKPIYVYRPGSLTAERQKEIFAIDDKQAFKRIAVMTESMMQLALPLSTYVLQQEHPDGEHDALPRVITDVTSIVDFEGASLSLLWTLRNHLKQASVLSSAHFPETLGSLALVNTPGFFSTIWSWVQKWFDEGTRKKMFIVSSAELRTGKLRDLIAPENLPKVYGGELAWRYEDEPDLDVAFRSALDAQQFPRGPAAWRNGKLYIYDAQERAQYPGALATEEEAEDKAAKEDGGKV